jgi:hypothetical protein
MNVAGHEHPAMNLHIELDGAFFEPAGVSGNVFVRCENRPPVIAALDNMERHTGWTVAKSSRYQKLPRSR